MRITAARAPASNAEANRMQPEDRAIHDWYRFVLSFPPHLVRAYTARFGLEPGQCVLDPFCGTGTVLVECKKLGLQSVGLEANPLARFASHVKLRWDVAPDGLLRHAAAVAERAMEELEGSGIEDERALVPAQPPCISLRSLPADAERLLLSNSISPLPLHKSLVLLECIEQLRDDDYYDCERLALARALVSPISNLHFGPEVGVGPAKEDAAVIAPWLDNVRRMANDLALWSALAAVPATVLQTDARQVDRALKPASVDAVITSPPYPNEKDYTRTTRLESVILGFITGKDDLQSLKRSLVRSNTRGVYKGDDDDSWVSTHPEIQRIADAIEERRLALGKTSGFERMYARVTRLYFGGMARHLDALRPVLRPGAQLAYVVGDQASYLRVMIRTGRLLAEIAHSLGYEVQGIEPFRTRLATATRAQLAEEVVVLRWPAPDGHVGSPQQTGNGSQGHVRNANDRRNAEQQMAWQM